MRWSTVDIQQGVDQDVQRLTALTLSAVDADVKAMVHEVNEKFWVLQTPQRVATLRPLVSTLTGGKRNDATRQYAAQCLRKLLSTERCPPIEEAIQAGAIAPLVKLACVKNPSQLQISNSKSKVVFEAVWGLTNIASGSAAHVRHIVESGALEALSKLMNVPNEALLEQIIWALGNIAGDCAEMRDIVFSNKEVVDGVTYVLAHADSFLFNTVRTAAWCASNLTRAKPLPDLRRFESLLRHVIRVWANWPAERTHGARSRSDSSPSGPDASASADEVQADLCWTLSYPLDGPNEDIDLILRWASELGVDLTRRFVKFVTPVSNCRHRLSFTPVLRALGAIASGEHRHTQAVVDAGAVPVLAEAVVQCEGTRRRDALFALSNVLAGTSLHVATVAQSGVLSEVVGLLRLAKSLRSQSGVRPDSLAYAPEEPKKLSRQQRRRKARQSKKGRLKTKNVPERVQPEVVREALWCVCNAVHGGNNDLRKHLGHLGLLPILLFFATRGVQAMLRGRSFAPSRQVSDLLHPDAQKHLSLPVVDDVHARENESGPPLNEMLEAAALIALAVAGDPTVSTPVHSPSAKRDRAELRKQLTLLLQPQHCLLDVRRWMRLRAELRHSLLLASVRAKEAGSVEDMGVPAALDAPDPMDEQTRKQYDVEDGDFDIGGDIDDFSSTANVVKRGPHGLSNVDVAAHRVLRALMRLQRVLDGRPVQLKQVSRPWSHKRTCGDVTREMDASSADDMANFGDDENDSGSALSVASAGERATSALPASQCRSRPADMHGYLFVYVCGCMRCIYRTHPADLFSHDLADDSPPTEEMSDMQRFKQSRFEPETPPPVTNAKELTLEELCNVMPVPTLQDVLDALATQDQLRRHVSELRRLLHHEGVAQARRMRIALSMQLTEPQCHALVCYHREWHRRQSFRLRFLDRLRSMLQRYRDYFATHGAVPEVRAIIDRGRNIYAREMEQARSRMQEPASLPLDGDSESEEEVVQDSLDEDESVYLPKTERSAPKLDATDSTYRDKNDNNSNSAVNGRAQQRCRQQRSRRRFRRRARTSLPQ
ncbi:MAG: hypothetical protein MHM6MM_002600 [Cercozoa sp. M6MM]